MQERTILSAIRRNLMTVIPDLDEGRISTDRSLAELGCNSIDRMEVVTGTMEDLGIVVPVPEFRNVNTIGALVDLLERWVK